MSESDADAKVPHYVRLSMKLKEETGDDRNYFYEEWENPDEIRKRQIQLVKLRKKKAAESIKRFQDKQRKKSKQKRKNRPPKAFMLSTDSKYRRAQSQSPIRHEAQSPQQHFDRSPVRVSHNDVMQSEVDRLQTKLIDMEAKYLNFILRGNPTHKKQVDDELQWLFGQIKENNERQKCDSSTYDYLQKKNEELRSELAASSDRARKANQKKKNCRPKCCKALIDDLNWSIDQEQDTGEMEIMLQKLENVMRKINKKKGIQTKCKKNKDHFFNYEYAEHDNTAMNMNANEKLNFSLPRKKMFKSKPKPKLKRKVKSMSKKKKNPNAELKKQQKDLRALNKRVVKLDEALRESSSILSDILIENA